MEPYSGLEPASAAYKATASPSMLVGQSLVAKEGFEPPTGVPGYNRGRYQLRFYFADSKVSPKVSPLEGSSVRLNRVRQWILVYH